MLDQVKRWFGGRDVVANLQEDQASAGGSLDQEIDAVRQTQMIDPSQLHAAREEIGRESKKAVGKPRKRAGRSRGSSKTSDGQAKLYRPKLRPPMAFLAALDDGSVSDAEIHRLRGGTVVVGRQDGDIQFPFEVLMSARHAQLECRRHRSGYQWHFTDLSSRNGSFFRVQRAYLRNDQEFLAGGHRFAFSLPMPGAAEDNSQIDSHATQLMGVPEISLPRLVYREVRDEREQSHTLKSTHLVIGADSATCGLSLTDEFMSPNHARIHHTPQGWLIEDLGSKNGIWLRLHEAKLDQNTEFQLGEQRFYFRPSKAL